MLAAKLVWKCLEREGVKTIFGYPGGALLPMYEALRQSSIEHILVRNEQAAPHYASGYARMNDTVGVCLATSGPGATNLVTGIATAYLDSIPVVAITGQVERQLIGSDAFQEADIFGATTPFTKHSYLIKNPEDIPRIIHEAFHIASTGRPGPVLIDIPRDVQNTNLHNIEYVDKVNIPGYKPTYTGHTGQIKRAIRKIKSCKRPVIYAGGGVRRSGAFEQILKFAEKTKIPVITSLMGIGAFPQNHPLYYGIVGSHGYEYSNKIMKEANLCICIGARMSNRSISPSTMDDLELIHIDIDPAEIGKNVNHTTIPIVGDAATVLEEFLSKEIKTDTDVWLRTVERIKSENPIIYDDYPGMAGVNPKIFFHKLSDITPEDTVLVCDVGLNQIWAAMHYSFYGKRHFYTSGGMGTMGYAIPASAGVALASRDNPVTVICVCGDGGFQMSEAELGVIAAHKLPVKILVLNNHKLGMVRQQQHDNYGNNHYSGVDVDYSLDFVKLASAYEIPGMKASTTEEALEKMKEILAMPGAALLECAVDEDFMRF